MAKFGSRADNDGRNRYEIIAQEHLLERNLTKLGIKLDIPRRTLTRIVAEQKFKNIFKQLKRELMNDARLEFRNNVPPAFKTILKIMNDEYVAPAVRLAAACKVIEYGLDADMVERFEERLEKLEVRTIDAVAVTNEAKSNPESNPNSGWVNNNSNGNDYPEQWQQ
jgi:hypothetical protein